MKVQQELLDFTPVVRVVNTQTGAAQPGLPALPHV